ncbi:MAG TPA: DUF2156 domain-containing protein [Planctomycetaceae bacterium]|jgi:phosphatidylglycerol lysyltransferase
MSHNTLPPKPRPLGTSAVEQRTSSGPADGSSVELPSSVDGGKVRLDRGNTRTVTAPKSHVRSYASALAVEQADVASAELQHFVFSHGQYFDSYLATEPGRLNFWSPTGPGLVSYARRGRHALVGGGLIAPEDHRAELLREFVEFASNRRLNVFFHNIGDDDLPAFRQLDFQITKWGEEPIIDLGSCTWGGKPFEWVRRQTNFCLRNGLQAFEVLPDTLEPEQWSRTRAEILEVSTESLSLKAQSDSMKFFEGRIDNHELGLRRLFIARSSYGAGRIEGFLICNPMREGTMWSTELYRRRLDSVRGTMAFLIHHTLQQLQAEGITRVGLCLDPGLNCETPLPGDSFLVRRGMTFGNRYLNAVFDVSGLRHFKSRFRPRYENRYVCALPKVSIGSVMAFASLSGLFNLSPTKLARVIMGHWRKGAARQSLDC